MAAPSRKCIQNEKQMFLTAEGGFTKAESKAEVFSARGAQARKTALATTHKGTLTIVDAPGSPAKAAAKPGKDKAAKPAKDKPTEAKPKPKTKKPKATATA